jgi:magnesium transporter
MAISRIYYIFSMAKHYKLQAGRLVLSEASEAQVIALVSPEQEEISALIKNYQIDEHTLSSVFDSDELARLEYEDEHIAIIYKRPKNYSAAEHFQFRVASSGIFLFENLVIIISDIELPLADEKKFSKLSSLKMLVLKLLNFATAHFYEHLRIINKMSNELEAKHIYKLKKEEYLIVFGLSKSLVYYMNAISSNEALLKRMQMSRNMNFDENEQEILDDIIIENLQCKRLTEIYSSVLENMMSSHEVSHESSTSGDIGALKILTILSVVIMIPTSVASIFSMNLKYPFDEEATHIFWIIFGFMIVGATAFWIWQIRKKW